LNVKTDIVSGYPMEGTANRKALKVHSPINGFQFLVQFKRPKFMKYILKRKPKSISSVSNVFNVKTGILSVHPIKKPKNQKETEIHFL